MKTLPPERTWAEISRSALEHNLHIIKSHLPTDTLLMPAIKAQAYGHGSEIVARILSQNAITHVAVANLYEALEVKQYFDPSKILLLSAPLASELPAIVEHGFASIISCQDDITLLEELAIKTKKKPPIHLKIDTGMGRLGCMPQDAHHLLTHIVQSHTLRLAGVMTHFASADVSTAATQRQLRKFLDTTAHLHLPQDCLLHASNSAGLLRYPKARLHMVRPGLALYGISPLKKFNALLRPALTWKSRITLIKKIPAGHGVSYASTFRAPRPMRIAIISVGYADGYPRSLSGKSHVLIRGHRCPLLGRVTMDEIMVDISKVPGPTRGEEVTLMGPAPHANTLAKLADTSPYELLTRIGTRVTRILIE